MPRSVLVYTPDGQKTAVIRPRSPELAARAVRLATEAVAHNDADAFQRIPVEVSEYQLRGYLARSRRLDPAPPTRAPYCIVGDDGAYLGDLEPGDSLVGVEDLARGSTKVGSA